jgi:hypothetical protein
MVDSETKAFEYEFDSVEEAVKDFGKIIKRIK